MGQTPFRHDRTAATHDSSCASRGQRDVRETHSGVNREVIDTLLRLFDKGVAKDLPRELFSLAANLLQRLINRHRANRHGRVAYDPFASGVNVLSGRKIHYGVRPAMYGPAHLVDFLFNRRSDGGISDVRVNFDEEVAADNHRLG